MSKALFIGYTLVLGVLCVYGLHRYQLVYLYYRYRKNVPGSPGPLHEWPRVTVQIPMYNERYVARRVIEQCCRLDYPPDRLEIQVLDDSTDDTQRIAREAVERWNAQGHDVCFLHREHRTGYKAGALQAGLERATGEFILVLDADFAPPRGLLRDLIPYFQNPAVGMVQGRWEHTNRDESILTQVQGVLLDGHFVMEHGARNRAGRFMSFNGTAGVWRRHAIEDAGGWDGDTLTEDLDLSYRAQMKGWKFLFLPQVSVPGELPADLPAFKAQQRRWSQGGGQTCRKLLFRVLRASVPWTTKLEAFFHLTGCTVYLYMVLLLGLLLPMLVAKSLEPRPSAAWVWLIDGSLFLLATCSAGSFYVRSQRELGRSRWESVRNLPWLIGLGVGLCPNNAWAALRGLCRVRSEFVRTPKYGLAERSDAVIGRRASVYRMVDGQVLLALIEITAGLYVCACIAVSIYYGWFTLSLPLFALFAWGFFYVGVGTLWAVRNAEPLTTGTVVKGNTPKRPAIRRGGQALGKLHAEIRKAEIRKQKAEMAVNLPASTDGVTAMESYRRAASKAL